METMTSIGHGQVPERGASDHHRKPRHHHQTLGFNRWEYQSHAVPSQERMLAHFIWKNLSGICQDTTESLTCS
ncbi:LIM domain-containing protein 1 [Clarias magur]|uniref:LIM domain-containing protein 1 n=1 Tax=Clarias magur TaxID=1594786 RepID=A0A8J4X5C5_CLAMG|nr:LIM domain-containing protein 1 [Clarias magur]